MEQNESSNLRWKGLANPSTDERFRQVKLQKALI